MLMLKNDSLDLHNSLVDVQIHYLSRENGSIGGITKPGPKLPVVKLGWRCFTDLIIQSAKFLSLREQTLTVEAAMEKER